MSQHYSLSITLFNWEKDSLLGKKACTAEFKRLISINKSGKVACTCDSSYAGHVGRRIEV
jgi:hypothetical protein